jgi:hypothetical protein
MEPSTFLATRAGPERHNMEMISVEASMRWLRRSYGTAGGVENR